MLEARVIQSIVDQLYKQEISIDLTRSCDPAEPIDAEMLENGAQYVLRKEILRGGSFFGEIGSNASEVSNDIYLSFCLNIGPFEAANLLMDLCRELCEKYDIIGKRVPSSILSSYALPYVISGPTQETFWEKAELAGNPVVFAGWEDSLSVDDIYGYDDFSERLMDKQFGNSLTKLAILMDGFGELNFWLDGGRYMAQIASSVDFIPLLPKLLGGTDLDEREKGQIIGFMNDLYARPGFFLGNLQEKEQI